MWLVSTAVLVVPVYGEGDTKIPQILLSVRKFRTRHASVILLRSLCCTSFGGRIVGCVCGAKRGVVGGCCPFATPRVGGPVRNPTRLLARLPLLCCGCFARQRNRHTRNTRGSSVSSIGACRVDLREIFGVGRGGGLPRMCSQEQLHVHACMLSFSLTKLQMGFVDSKNGTWRRLKFLQENPSPADALFVLDQS